LLAHRAQEIKRAHAFSTTTPDYSRAEGMMGWGIQQGGALVSPALTRCVASRAAERSSILKEQRKYAEEMRLRRPGSGKGGGEGNVGMNKDQGSTQPQGGGQAK
jgi:hypothetical protein